MIRAMVLIVVFAVASFSVPAFADQHWPLKDPDQEITKTDFTVAWALKLAGFKTLAQLQKAAGSGGKITENHAQDEKNQRVSFHWRIHAANGDIGSMLMSVSRDGVIEGSVMTDEGVEIIINTLGAL